LQHSAIKERKQDIHEERERAACRNILEDYVPGSAVICGLLHADSLGKLLAKKFRVKVYLVAGTREFDDKPLLVIIGEFHEYAAERMLIDAKKLKVKPAADGRKKLLVDRSSDYESTKKSIRLLNRTY